jgi:hypothetical protein
LPEYDFEETCFYSVLKWESNVKKYTPFCGLVENPGNYFGEEVVLEIG